MDLKPIPFNLLETYSYLMLDLYDLESPLDFINFHIKDSDGFNMGDDDEDKMKLMLFCSC